MTWLIMAALLLPGHASGIVYSFPTTEFPDVAACKRAVAAIRETWDRDGKAGVVTCYQRLQ